MCNYKCDKMKKTYTNRDTTIVYKRGIISVIKFDFYGFSIERARTLIFLVQFEHIFVVVPLTLSSVQNRNFNLITYVSSGFFFQ